MKNLHHIFLIQFKYYFLLKISLFVLFFSLFTPSFAQNEGSNKNSEELEATEVHAFYDRKIVSKIEVYELPQGIQRVMANGEFKKWDIEEVYKIHSGQGSVEGHASYIITVKRRFDHFALYYGSDARLIRQERVEATDKS